MKFLARMQGKKLLFLGDSLSRENFLSFGCMLLVSTTATAEISSGSAGAGKSFQKLHLPEYNFTVLFQLENEVPEIVGFLSYHHFTAHDTVVANWGAWWNLEQDARSVMAIAGSRVYQQAKLQLTAALGAFNELTSEHRPRLIWRESAAQHFDTPGGLWYSGEGMPRLAAGACLQGPLEEQMALGNWRNSAVEPILRKSSIPVLRVFASTAGAAEYHTGEHPPRRANLPPGFDCTHYYLPGPTVDHWTFVLFSVLVLD
jgi:hypothetical protein